MQYLKYTNNSCIDTTHNSSNTHRIKQVKDVWALSTGIIEALFANLMHNFFLLNLSYSSTCFEHYCAHHQKGLTVHTHTHTYICIIWFLISPLSLGDRSAHKLEEYNRFNKEIVHQVGKQYFYYIRMHSQQTIKKKSTGGNNKTNSMDI